MSLKRKCCNLDQADCNQRAYNCTWPDCTATFTTKYALTRHQSVHTGVKPHKCDWNNCNFQCASSSSMKRHKLNMHTKTKRFKPFKCDYTNCSFAGRDKWHLNHHKRVHTGEKPYKCDWQGCEFSFKSAFNLKRHQECVHDNRRDHVCPQCAAAFGTAESLNTHVRTVHEKCRDHVCPQCGAAFGTADTLNRHVRAVHEKCRDYVCPECATAFANTSNLKRHREFVHDIGTFLCDYCKQPRNSQNEHEGHKICRACYRKVTGKNSRIEHIWSDFVDEHFGTDFLVGSNNSMRTLGGCSLKRPDRLYASLDRVEIDECDERQHNMSSGNYLCEQKRLSELYDEPSICGKQMVIIRWNPDAYNGPKVSRQERLDLFVRVKRHTRLCTFEPFKIVIVYMFYNRDNPHICRDLPHFFVDCADDIAKLSAPHTE